MFEPSSLCLFIEQSTINNPWIPLPPTLNLCSSPPPQDPRHQGGRRTRVAVFVSGVGALMAAGAVAVVVVVGRRALMMEAAAGVTCVGALPEANRDCWLLSRDWRSAGRLFCGSPSPTVKHDLVNVLYTLYYICGTTQIHTRVAVHYSTATNESLVIQIHRLRQFRFVLVSAQLQQAPFDWAND